MTGDPTCVYVVITFADGFIMLMKIHKVVRAITGKVIRAWEIDAPYVEHMIAKASVSWAMPLPDGSPSPEAAHLPVASWRPIDPADVPDSVVMPGHPLLKYRPAARDTGTQIIHDLDAAKAIAIDRARAEREIAFKDLDARFSAALGKKDQAAAEAVEATRQALRDRPQVLQAALANVTSIDDLHAIVTA